MAASLTVGPVVSWKTDGHMIMFRSTISRWQSATISETESTAGHMNIAVANHFKNNKLCTWRHNMLPPLSSLSGRRSPSRRRANRNSSTFPRWPLQLPDALTQRCVKRPGDLDLWPEGGVWVTCDVRYLCANFGLPRPLFSRPRPDVRDRHQLYVRQTSDKSIA